MRGSLSIARPRGRSRFFLATATVFVAMALGCVDGHRSTAADADNPDSTNAASRLSTLNDHFPFTVPASLEFWRDRAATLRLQTRVALGLHPQPQLADPQPVIHSRREMDGYRVEKVYLETLPGLWLSGTLFRPQLNAADEPARLPAVLYAHGHWQHGRFHRTPDAEVKQSLATGAERFESAAINPMQAACVQLARMGCVVFQYDMLGSADNQQISYERAHRFGLKSENAPLGPDGWLLFSPIAEGYGQSPMSIQTINSLQAFEMVSRLPDVDPSRIAITGASGGATQSFIASAVEERLAGSFPAVMVSTAMQGGCTCENACGLRVATGNVELAALSAPRPLGMTAADDWTKTMPTDGFPELRRLYALYGKPDAVQLYPNLHFPHNYNHVSRVAMYGWMNRLFGLGLDEPILEQDFQRLTADELTVWDLEHPQPRGGLEWEQEFVRRWAEQIDGAFQGALTSPADTDRESRARLLEGWSTIWRPALDVAGALSVTASASADAIEARDSGGRVVGTLVGTWDGANGSQAGQDPARGNPAPLPLWIDLGAMVQADGERLSVAALDDPLAALEGEPGNTNQPLVNNGRPAAAYTYGYNPPSLVRRAGVLVALLDEIHRRSGRPIAVSASVEALPLAAAAALLLPDQVTQVRWTGDRRTIEGYFRRVTSITDARFLPGALRYQDLPGLLRILPSPIVEQKGVVEKTPQD